MRDTLAAYKHLDMPWILMGDFNVTLSSGEHSRVHDYLTDQRGMRQFQDAVTDCALSDLAYTGALFTWWNKRESDPIGKKLDRALINGDWLRVLQSLLQGLKLAESLIMPAASFSYLKTVRRCGNLSGFLII